MGAHSRSLIRNSDELYEGDSMTRLLFIILLFLSSAPAYAEWVEVTGNEQGDVTVYANPDTIRRKEEMVEMWVLFDFKTIRTVGDHSFLSIRNREEYDCAGERNRTLTFSEFSGNMGDGKAVYSNSDEQRWESVVPESLAQALWKFACKSQ
jgi:hypothetical protein